MDPSGPSYRVRRASFLSSSIAPFTLFGPSLFEKEGQLGWRLNNYRLTVQCSWVDGWDDGMDGDKVNGMTVRKAEVVRYTKVWQVVRKHLWRITHVVFWLVFTLDRSVASSSVHFSYKTTPFSSHFSTFPRNTLSKHVRHICQRSVRSIPAFFVLIRSHSGSVSNFFLFLRFFFIFHSLWKPFIWLLCPVTLSKPVSLRFCHYM